MLNTDAVEGTVDEAAFKAALSQFASGVTIITTHDSAGDIHGMTATAFCSLSLRPPLVLVAIGHGTRCHKHILATGRFGISVLRDDQRDLSRHFGGRPNAEPRFVLLDGLSVIEDALVQLSCRLEAPQDGGDHSIFIGRVTAARTSQGDPLIHFAGHYRTLASPTSP